MPFVPRKSLLARVHSASGCYLATAANLVSFAYRSLDHPQISKLLCVFIGASKVMMVMEFCRGGDRYRTLRRQFEAFKRGLLEDAAKHVMLQVGLAVTYLHSRHVARRDIKSTNVFISRQCEPDVSKDAHFKLGDFGVARVIPAGETTVQRVGAPSIAAPEIVLRRPHGCACDVWGMGTLHFELLAGKQMFRKVRLFSEMEALLENAVALVEHMADAPRMSEFAQDLMLRMLQVVPENRLLAADLLQHPWIVQR